jgi:predicted ATPase
MIVEAFGKRIQAYLRASGYSQKELAAALGMHYKVLSRKFHESANAHFSHREVHDLILILVNWQAITSEEEVHNLFVEAQIDPSAIFRATEWQEPPLTMLTRRVSPTRSVHQAEMQHNLPAPLGPLIGRSWAVTRLQQLLGRQGTRLVTLIGPGGSGKTSLALSVAHELLDSFPQGVWFISFIGVDDPAMVPLTIAQSLNIKSASGQNALHSLRAYLSQRQLLLVLDNFEHLEAAGEVIEDLLAGSPGLKVLLTSRIVLHLSGEHELSVPPLDLPDPDLAPQLDAEELAHYSAIQLFVERAQAVLPSFTLTDENAPLIAQICACVDGLPLALELAAARVKMLPLATLLERLSRARLPLLSRASRLSGRRGSSRHQTLSDTIKWSYDLLDQDEQTWFRRLGVFVDGWALESFEAMMHELSAVEQKTIDESSPLDVLTRLANHSLLARVDNTYGRARFTMLSTLREYALAQLEAHGETEWLHDWHACYFLRGAEEAELGLRGPRQFLIIARVTDARANIRAALEWSLQKAREGKLIHTFTGRDGSPRAVASSRILSQHAFPSEGVSAREINLRMATAMRAYWEWQGLLMEARYWLHAALELPIDRQASPTLLAARARALSQAARLMVLQNDQEKALDLADQSITLWRQLNDPPGLANALFHRAWALHGRGQYATAREVYQEALESLSSETDTWLYAQILLCMAATAGFTSDFEHARLYYERCRALFEQIGDKSGIADSWKDQGGILIIAGEYDEAISCLLTSIQICRQLNHKQYIATALGSLSFAFGLREGSDPQAASLRSARVQGAAESLMAAIGLIPWTDTTPFIQAIRQHIRSRVDEKDWQAALEAGRALSLDQALEMVIHMAQSLQI